MLRKSILTTSIFLCLFACKSGVPDSEVVARVNGEAITKTQFQEIVDRNMARYSGQNHQLPPGIAARIQESVLRRMIDDTIVEQKAKTLKLEVTEPEV
ncbi:MAG TPA: SurA N-terminal domain-containing protein, partial [Myxococcota bacterium]|nr:SurA N-terminal domain-containing protein [Myxococcota bacterium]